MSQRSTKRSRATQQLKDSSLSGQELFSITRAWEHQVGEGCETLYTEEALLALFHSLHVQTYEALFEFARQRFADWGSQLALPQFIKLFQETKDFHRAFLDSHPSMKDDLADAFVAVGGMDSTEGFVDLDEMQRLMAMFQLAPDLQKIVEEIDEDGNRQIDFSEFTALLSGSDSLEVKKKPHSTGKGPFPGSDTQSDLGSGSPQSPRGLLQGLGSPSPRDVPLLVLSGSFSMPSPKARMSKVEQHLLQIESKQASLPQYRQKPLSSFYRQLISVVSATPHLSVLQSRFGREMRKVDSSGQLVHPTPTALAEIKSEAQRLKSLSARLHTTTIQNQRGLRTDSKSTSVKGENAEKTGKANGNHPPTPPQPPPSTKKLSFSVASASTRPGDPDAESSDGDHSDPEIEHPKADTVAPPLSNQINEVPPEKGRQDRPGSPESVSSVSSASTGFGRAGPSHPNHRPRDLSLKSAPGPKRSVAQPTPPVKAGSVQKLPPTGALARPQSARTVHGSSGVVSSSGARQFRSSPVSASLSSPAAMEKRQLKFIRQQFRKVIPSESRQKQQQICLQDDYGLPRLECDAKLFELYYGLDSQAANAGALTERGKSKAAVPPMSDSSALLSKEEEAQLRLKMHNVDRTEVRRLVKIADRQQLEAAAKTQQIQRAASKIIRPVPPSESGAKSRKGSISGAPTPTPES
jgi:hypothetical protein